LDTAYGKRIKKTANINEVQRFCQFEVVMPAKKWAFFDAQRGFAVQIFFGR